MLILSIALYIFAAILFFFIVYSIAKTRKLKTGDAIAVLGIIVTLIVAIGVNPQSPQSLSTPVTTEVVPIIKEAALQPTSTPSLIESTNSPTTSPSLIAPSENIVYLSALSPQIVDTAGGNYCIGRDPVGDPPTCTGAAIEVNGIPYPHSLFAHANSTLVYDLNGRYDTFVTSIFLFGSTCGDGASFGIQLDGKEVFSSPNIKHGDAPRGISISVKNANILRLDTSTGPNGDYSCDGTVWGEPHLISGH